MLAAAQASYRAHRRNETWVPLAAENTAWLHADTAAALTRTTDAGVLAQPRAWQVAAAMGSHCEQASKQRTHQSVDDAMKDRGRGMLPLLVPAPVPEPCSSSAELL